MERGCSCFKKIELLLNELYFYICQKLLECFNQDWDFTMNKLLLLLKQPHPAYDDLKVYFRTILFIAIGVFLILYLLRPNDMSGYPSEWHILKNALLYPAAGFIMMALSTLWIVGFPNVFAQKNWNLGREIVFVAYQFTSVAFIVWLTHYWIVHGGDKAKSFSLWKMMFIVWTTGFLPYILVSLTRHFLLLKKRLKVAGQINENLELNPVKPLITNPSFLHITDEKIPKISGDDFLFLESRGNYLHVFCENEGDIREFRIRETIRKFREDNADFPNLFHSHRAFVVNLDKIIRIDGNAAGYFLHVHPKLHKVPVSRSHIEELRALFPDSSLQKARNGVSLQSDS